MTQLPQASIALTCWGPDVYEPSDDTFLLTDVLETAAQEWAQTAPCTFVELGCGSGFVICSIALMLQKLGLHASVQAVDHSQAALEATQQTLTNHKVASVELLQCDLLACHAAAGLQSIDVLIFNPPYVPTPDEEVYRGGVATAWAGGNRGRVVIDRLLQQLPELLRPGGQLYMVTVSENDPQGIIREMSSKGFKGEVLKTRQADEETLSVVRLVRQ